MAKRTMKLQVNTAGSWKNVVEFEAKDRAAVQAAAGLLARILGASAKWCIVDDFGHREWLTFSANPNDVINDSALVIQAVAEAQARGEKP